MHWIAQEFIKILADLGSFSWEFINTPYGKLRIGNMGYPNGYYHLRSLEKKKIVVRKKVGNKNLYFLTKKGQKIRVEKLFKERTDGLLTMAIFDIPTSQNKARTSFRKYLLKNGFVNVQKSVMVSRFLPDDELRGMVKRLKISGFVKLISAKFLV